MNQDIRVVAQRYLEMAQLLGAASQHICFHLTPQDDGSPHIEYEGDELIYVHTERGERYGERRTSDVNELLYWLVSDLIWAMAQDYELSHRAAGADCRRQLFSKQIELFTLVDPSWAKQKQAEIDRILVDHPFHDERG